ncbi:MAG TPA: PEP-utilizing enzyme [Candidatus Binatia bacterium]
MQPIWTRRIADEFWSGPVTPLTYSLLSETMAEHMVRRVLRQAGLGRLAEEPVLRRSLSHVYVNGALLAEVVSLLPPILRSDGLLHLLPPEIRERLAPTSALTATARTVEMVARFALQEPSWSPWQRAAAFESTCAAVRTRFGAERPPQSEETLDRLLDDLRAARSELGRYLEGVSWGVVYAYVFYHLLQELCRRWAPGREGDHAALTVGLPDVASLEAARDIAALGRLLADDPALVATARADLDGAARAVGSRGGPAGDALQAILERHGHRLVGRDLSCASWRERPEIVVGLAVRSLERHPPEDAARRRLDAAARVEAAVAAGSAGALRVRVFDAALAAAQRYYVVRENMRYYADFFLVRMRELARAAGARLVAQGRLACADDVFFLALEELDEPATASLMARTAERREALARDAAWPPPTTLDAHETPTPEVPPPHADGGGPLTMRGECAAPGTCRGRARVVRDTADFASFAPGDIMVAGYTDPGWTPVLELACGLVLDAGGLLSHGAIVARELGIPALVNVADATRTIRDGDQLELDATAGLLRIVRAAQSGAQRDG